ncbi:UNVERIFIED_CONTAM: hypothetical protein FKN15_038713 [Acipenser sinensis]
MYSVEDLLISHGYKLPKNAPSADKNRYADCHHEITENRSGHATVNGYETDTGAYLYSRQAPAKGYFSENECRGSSQRRKAGSGNQGDTQPSGDFHTTDAGFYDGSSRMYSSRQRNERDVAYWRRRGQDFSVLLNYADSGEPRGNNSSKPEGVRQELFAKDPKSERESTCLKEQDVVQGNSDDHWQQEVAKPGHRGVEAGCGVRKAAVGRRRRQVGTRAALPQTWGVGKQGLKHMPGGPCGNPLTDSDKIKNIKKEMPTDKVFEQSTQDSAFLIPPGLIYDVASKASNTEHANSNRWLSASQKGSDNLVASNQNCALYHKDQSNPYQTRMSRQYPQPDQGFAETVTQVKKFEPGAGMERKRNSTRTLNETIFCLVSVPVHLQPNGQSLDQNNNTMTLGTVENAAGKNTGNLQNQTLRSTSSTDLELQALTGHMMNHKAGRKPQLRTDADNKEVGGLKSSQLQKHKELRYSGSWPGDQYRDQETQTSYIEPLQGANQGAPSNQAHNQCHSDFETKELNLDTEGNRYVQHGYPMKGQMCLNPSSNSAFSRTTNFSNQVNKSTAHQIQPSGNLGEKDISAMRCETKPSSASNGKAAFGQFLLKPVSRRPWDAIEELESINKELQDQIGTRAGVNQFIGDPEIAYEELVNLQIGSCDTEIVNTEVWDQKHVQSSLPEPPPYKTSRMKCVSQSSTIQPDPEYNNRSDVSQTSLKTVGVSSVGSEACTIKSTRATPLQNQQSEMSDVSQTSLKTVGVSRLAQKNNPIPQEHKYGDIRAVSQTSLKSVVTSRTSKQDTPFPSEPLYGDIDAVSQTALKTVSELSKQGKIEPGRKVKKDISISKVNGEERSSNSFGIAIKDSSFQEIRSINCNINTQQEERKRINGLTVVTFLPDKDNTNESDDDDDDDDNVSCNWITYKTDKTQSAEDIPENEPLEVRAARILGIDVPVESLAIADQLLELDKAESLTERHAFTKGVTECTNGKSGHVRGELEYSCAGDTAGSVVYVGHKEERELTKARKENNIICQQKCHVENRFKGDPEKGENVSGKFLVPGAIEETMVATAPNSDKKSRSTSRMIEALQGKLASSPSQSILERMVRMKEVDSVSRMRRLSIKSSDPDEAEHEKTPKQLQQETGGVFTFTTHRDSLNNHSSQGAAVTRRIITLTQRKGRLREDEEGIYLSGRNIFGAAGMLLNLVFCERVKLE